jgi:hypothetical protein
MRITYQAIVDPDVKYDARKFAEEVSVYLQDPHGWKSQGYTFEESKHPAVLIHLSSPKTIQQNGCDDPTLSCAEMNGRHMHLNAMRWTGSMQNRSKLDLYNYRQYMVSHEMGHILGKDHVACPGPGQPAPIMMQQTLGIGECVPNTRVSR